jgi:glutaconate CoA-transferase subunit B
MNPFTLDELMVIEASRYITNGDVVMVGTGLPMVASLLALKTHAPDMCYVVETGPVAPDVIPTPTSVADARVMHRSVTNGSLIGALGEILQRGLADVGFIGGAQIDQFANVNSTVIGDYSNPKVRLPGSGGANDIASHAKKILIITRHERRRFPVFCDYITSPGYIDGPEGRKNAGIPVPYPEIHVVTNLAVMSINKGSGKLVLRKLMPGVTKETVLSKTFFNPESKIPLQEVMPASKQELEMLRDEVDPKGIYIARD